MSSQTDGAWGDLLDWPLIGLHAIVTQDGKVLTFGTDSQGMQGGQFIYDVYDPVTGTHYTLQNTTPTDIFCSAAIIIPGTDQILIGGGDARPLGSPNTGVNDVNIFNATTFSLTQYQFGEMNYERWYPTMVSLASGQIVILGGTDFYGRGVSTPEIFTPGEGWRTLTGATDTDLGAASYYPRTWVNLDGNVVYFGPGRGNNNQFDVMMLDPSGDGSVTRIGTLPFTIGWDLPAIMYEPGHVLIMATNGTLWTMDITGQTPVFSQTTTLSQHRAWADMTVMADGRILINGGTASGNLEAYADHTAAIWDPATGAITYGADEDQPRLYHSATVLLTDGTLLSLGGGSAGMAENNYLDGQIYSPDYLYDDNGALADRPIITSAPDSVRVGQVITISVDNAADITRLTLVKTGAATHSINMEARVIDLDYAIGPNNTLIITLPENPNALVAGNWMLFAWNSDGTPSIAPIISVEPAVAVFDGIGDLRADVFSISGTTTTLDQIAFDATPLHSESVSEISYTLGASPFYAGGPADHFAVRLAGPFDVARTGSHTFYLTSDDGARLYIDGQLVINNDGLHAPIELSQTIWLEAGQHQIEVRYFEAEITANLDLDWAGPGFVRTQMTFDGSADNLVTNGSFENLHVAGNFAIFNSIPGWTSSAGTIELQNGNGGQVAAAGTQWLELDTYAGQIDSIYQDIQTTSGQTYALSFSAAQRTGYTGSTNTIEVLWNGTVIGVVEPQSTTWSLYSFNVTGSGGLDRLTFRELAAGDDSVGAHIDSVQLVASGPPPQTGSELLIFASGAEGTESMELRINGVVVERFDNVPTSGAVFTYQSGALLQLSQIEIAMVGSVYDPANGIDENLTIDRIVLDGSVHQTEAASTYSTGTWLLQDGLASGYGRGDTLHADGSFHFAHNSGTGAPSLIQIYASGSEGTENMSLLINNVVVATYEGVGTSQGVYTYQADSSVRADQIRIALTNEVYDPRNGIDTNLTVDRIVIDGVTFQTEAASVYSTGTWLPQDGIAPGYGRGDTLHGNGFFAYGSQDFSTETVIEIRAAGTQGGETMELRIGGTTVATFENLAATLDTFQFVASGDVNADDVSIAFVNDAYDPANGVDLNLYVDYISIHGIVFQTEDKSVYSTGTWLPADGLTAGYGRGEILHTNGVFQFANQVVTEFALTA